MLELGPLFEIQKTYLLLLVRALPYTERKPMAAPIMTVDFTRVSDRQSESVVEPPRDNLGKLLTPKQIRARARRRAARLGKDIVTAEEMGYLYQKPVEEWDLEELAAGRPKNAKGHFKGPQPKWITRELHEEAMNQYTLAVKKNMRMTTVDALTVISRIITDESVDEKGKPNVAASTKLDASKFLLEHVVGKPTQRIENDVSVKLQGILAQVMVNPNDVAPNYELGHMPGITMQMGVAVYDEDEDLDGDGE